MKYLVALAAIIGFGAKAVCHAESDSSALGNNHSEQTESVDESAIRKVIESYTDAFNNADANRLASHWAEAGQLVTSEGTVIQGQQALTEAFANYFTQNPGVQLELVGVSLNVMSPHVAVETGTARTLKPDQAPEESTYEAVHVKSATGWKMDSVREFPAAPTVPSHYEQLASLEWMVGTWGNDDDGSQIESSCRWTTNRNYLARTFRVIDDRVDFEGTQIIGWDPQAQAIRSWVFDSDGGFGAGRWQQNGNRWTVQTIHHLPDGRRGTATNTYELVDNNTVRFASTARVVDGELLPSIDPVEISRR